MNPIGVVAKRALALAGKADPTRVCIALTALLGAANALGAFALFRLMGGSRLHAALASCVFALSMSQLILSIVPDTSSLATLSLVATYLLFWAALQRRPVSPVAWIASGVFSLGVTTTNFAQTLICYGMTRLAVKERSLRAAVKPVLWFGCAVGAVAIGRALLQKLIYPSAVLFFIPSAYTEDRRYASLMIFEQPVRVLAELAKQFLVDSVVGPVPQTVDVGKALPGVSFATSTDYSISGYMALALWCAFGLAGAMFGNITLPILALLLVRPLGQAQRWIAVPLGVLAVAMALNNLEVIARLIALYDRF